MPQQTLRVLIFSAGSLEQSIQSRGVVEEDTETEICAVSKSNKRPEQRMAVQAFFPKRTSAAFVNCSPRPKNRPVFTK